MPATIRNLPDSSSLERVFDWKHLVPPVCGLFVLFALTVGFQFNGYKGTPAPVTDAYPYELDNLICFAFFGGDCFQVAKSFESEVYFLILQGADTPKPGQKFFRKSRRALMRMARREKVRVVFLERDAAYHQLGRAYAGDVDLSLELVKRGFAWYDGTDFEDADKFKAAEQAARESRIGLWVQDNPVHPSEFEAKRSRN